MLTSGGPGRTQWCLGLGCWQEWMDWMVLSRRGEKKQFPPFSVSSRHWSLVTQPEIVFLCWVQCEGLRGSRHIRIAPRSLLSAESSAPESSERAPGPPPRQRPSCLPREAAGRRRAPRPEPLPASRAAEDLLRPEETRGARTRGPRLGLVVTPRVRRAGVLAPAPPAGAPAPCGPARCCLREPTRRR